jgi:hypothetical protein
MILKSGAYLHRSRTRNYSLVLIVCRVLQNFAFFVSKVRPLHKFFWLGLMAWYVCTALSHWYYYRSVSAPVVKLQSDVKTTTSKPLCFDCVHFRKNSRFSIPRLTFHALKQWASREYVFLRYHTLSSESCDADMSLLDSPKSGDVGSTPGAGSAIKARCMTCTCSWCAFYSMKQRAWQASM